MDPSFVVQIRTHCQRQVDGNCILHCQLRINIIITLISLVKTLLVIKSTLIIVETSLIIVEPTLIVESTLIVKTTLVIKATLVIESSLIIQVNSLLGVAESLIESTLIIESSLSAEIYSLLGITESLVEPSLTLIESTLTLIEAPLVKATLLIKATLALIEATLIIFKSSLVVEPSLALVKSTLISVKPTLALVKPTLIIKSSLVVKTATKLLVIHGLTKGQRIGYFHLFLKLLFLSQSSESSATSHTCLSRDPHTTHTAHTSHTCVSSHSHITCISQHSSITCVSQHTHACVSSDRHIHTHTHIISSHSPRISSELIPIFLHLLHLIRIKPILPPVSLGIILPPTPIQVISIKIIVRPVVQFSDEYLLQHLLISNSIIHNLIAIDIPNNIIHFIRSQEPITIIIIEFKKLLTFSFSNITIDIYFIEDQLQEIVELVNCHQVIVILISHIETCCCYLIDLLTRFVVDVVHMSRLNLYFFYNVGLGFKLYFYICIYRFYRLTFLWICYFTFYIQGFDRFITMFWQMAPAMNCLYIQFKFMSFQIYFDKADKENKELLAEFNKKSNDLPIEVEKLIAANEKKLQNFIENFQNQIIALKNSEERDCKMIDNISLQNQQRLMQILLVEDATTMQKNLCQKLHKNNKILQSTTKQIESRISKHQQNINRNQLDYEQLQKKMLTQSKNRELIQIDKQNNRLLVRFNKDNRTCYFEIGYNKKQDKFGINVESKVIRQAVTQFNFHRNMNKLCADLYQFS